MHLEPARVRSWKDLIDAFLKQNKYNMNMALDRMQLQGMMKKSFETFKEYAQRSRELAAQVEPPLYEKEMTTMFIETLQSPFYEHVLGSIPFNFSNIVTIGERIEHGLKSGKIAQGSSAITNARKPGFNPNKKKEGEIQTASTVPHWGSRTPPYYKQNYQSSSAQFPHMANAMPSYQQGPSQQQVSYQAPVLQNNSNQVQAQNQGVAPKGNFKQERNFVNFTPIPMTYTKLLPRLLQSGLVASCPPKPLQPPYPKNYDENAKCDYHGGAPGHSTEKCMALKHNVQALIDSKRLTFQEKPSVEKNPLSGHTGASTNAIIPKEEHHLVRTVDGIQSSMRSIFVTLFRVGLMKLSYNQEDMCGFHSTTQHSIEECTEFK